MSPYLKIQPVARDAVRWTGGFWKSKLDIVRDVSLPSVLSALDDPDNATYFGNFTAAAEGSGPFHGVDWSDGDCYKTLETMLLLNDLAADPKLERQISAWVAEIAAAQEQDGYINTQITLTDRARWSDIEHHELYNFGHLFTAAVLHHQVTGQETLLKVAMRAADYLYQTFKGRDPELAKFGFNPSQIMGLVELYRETGLTDYLHLARIFVENRGAHPELAGNNGDQSQMRVPMLDETEAVGHAVTGPYLWAGAADIAMETGEQALIDAVIQIWEDSTYRKMYITGGIGALHKGSAERSHPRYEPIAEAYGRPYQLPNDSAYNETCANIANAMWSWRLLHLTGDARYADVIERVLLNSALSAVSLDGEAFTYSNPLRFNGPDHFIISNDSARRWTRWRCYCCPPQVTRTLAGLHRWAYGAGQDAIWVHLYGTNSVVAANLGFALTQQSDFPWSGDVRLEVEEAPDHDITLHLRIPGWSTKTTVSVNGVHVPIEQMGAHYIAIRRRWTSGDRVSVCFDLSPQLVVGRPEIEEVRNQAAVMCGPVVYCLEQEDLPGGVSLDDVVITPQTQFRKRSGEGELAGVPVLDVTLTRRPPWHSSELYAPLDASPLDPIDTCLIPYFAWNNRADNRMTVWLPLQGAYA